MEPRLPGPATTAKVLAIALRLLMPARAHAGCNIIPPASQSFASTRASITSPIAAPGHPVELHLSVCDALQIGSVPTFSASDVVTIDFLPAGPGQPPPVRVSTFSVDNGSGTTCTSPPCNRLVFTMPDTGHAGPAEIVVTNGGAEVARIGPLSQPHEVGSSCDEQPETIFRQFTVLPNPNDFSTATHVRATLDGSGSLLVPIDWQAALPSGPGSPTARLLSATLAVAAFPTTSGHIHVTSDDVRSFTIDGKPLPPLIRVTDAGDTVVGTSDALFSVIRIARLTADGQPNFDLSYLPSFATHEPIVLGPGDFAASLGRSLPLEDLRSSPTGAVFATDESVDQLDLNGDGDFDTSHPDHVVQLLDSGSGHTSNTGVAASFVQSAIVGRVAVAVKGDVAATIQSEARENQTDAAGSDLNGNGQTTDDLLRVFDVQGDELTPSPPTRLASLFPAINRYPIAIDGSLVYYRTPDVQLGFKRSIGSATQLAMTSDGRYMVIGSSVNGTLTLKRRNPVTGLPTAGVGPTFVAGNANLPNNESSLFDVSIVSSFQGFFAFAAVRNLVSSVATSGLVAVKLGIGDADSELSFITSRTVPILGDPTPAPTVSLVHNVNQCDPVNVGTTHQVDGLHGVTRVFTIETNDGAGARFWLYALSPTALTAFDVTPPANGEILVPTDPPTLTYRQTVMDSAAPAVGCSPGCTPSTAVVCLPNMSIPSDLVTSPNGDFVYVLAAGSGVLKRFHRLPNSPTLVFDSDTSVSFASGLAISPDGKHLYTSTIPPLGQHQLLSFARDATTGALTPGASYPVTGSPNKLVMSPDGRALYASTTLGGGNLYTFERDTTTGALTLASTVVPAMTGNVAMSPDSEHLYQMPAIPGLAYRLARTGALRAFDVTTGTDRPGLDAPTNLVVAAGGRAAFIDASNDAIGLYDSATDTTTTVATGPAIDATKLAMSAHAIATSNLLGLVAVSTVPPFTAFTPPLSASVIPADLGVTDVCEGGTSAGNACTTGADCPDGSCGAVVVFTDGSGPLRLFHTLDGTTEQCSAAQCSSGTVPDALRNVVDFQIAGDTIAFRVAEAGSADLNHDGDTHDIVMFAYDFKSRRVFSTEMASRQCQVAGCTPGVPYSVRDGAIFFTTNETDQNCTSAAGPSFAADCTDVGFTGVGSRDLNGDGTKGVVLQIFGDADRDGVFDPYDDCHDAANPDQVDRDGDRLGDACDPSPTCVPLTPAAPTIPSPALATCQKTIGGASRSLLKAVLSAERQCLDRIAAGTLTPPTSTVCLAIDTDHDGVVDGPTDAKTAAKIATAVTKLETSIAAKCPDASLLQLAACGNTKSTLAACVSARTLDASTRLLDLLYGDAAITDADALKCQKLVGKAGSAALIAVAKTIGHCLDAVNARTLSGDPAELCLGAWTQSGPVPPADTKTASGIAKVVAKVRQSAAKCAPPALPALGSNLCGGGTAEGTAACIQCESFAETAAVIADTY